MAIFEIKNFCFTYPNGMEEALNNISLTLEEGRFYVFCGRSGCGKSTLLRQMKSVLAPEGKCQGTVRYRGRLLQEVSAREQSAEIGFVFQNPDNQLVTDKVWHELAFGLESLGMESESIHLRVAEMASYFGIQSWFHRSVEELSGGQKQLLNLASVMVMHPRVLILDEPAAQLAPVAAAELWQTLARIHQELGITIILAEHQLEEVAGYADKIFVMEQGGIAAEGTAEEVGQRLCQSQHPTANSRVLTQNRNQLDSYAAIYPAMPAAMQIYAAVGGGGKCPCSVAEGRRWLKEKLRQAREKSALKIEKKSVSESTLIAEKKSVSKSALKIEREPITKSTLKLEGKPASESTLKPEREPILKSATLSTEKESALKPDRKLVLTLRDVWFRYKPESPDILKGLSLEVREGEIFALMGDNAAGKSTALKIIAGLYQAQRGRISICGKRLEKYNGQTLYHGLLGVLPQEPASLFVKKTVREDLEAVFVDTKKEKKALHLEEKKLPLPHTLFHTGTENVQQVMELLKLESLSDRHPFDLSGGEQQRVALAKVLLLQPCILLLDEPTKGLDAGFKKELGGILKKLSGQGVTILLVSHDIEFCARFADRAGLFFDGQLTAARETRAFFAGNQYYTTAANRIAGEYFPEAILPEEVTEELQAARLLEEAGEIVGEIGIAESQQPRCKQRGIKQDTLQSSVVLTQIRCQHPTASSVVLTQNRNKAEKEMPLEKTSENNAEQEITEKETAGRTQLEQASDIQNSETIPHEEIQDFSEQHENTALLSGKFLAFYLLGLAAFLPLIIWVGGTYFADRQYFLTGLAIALYGVLPFFYMTDIRKISVRRLVVLSVLTAIAVAGRAAFFMMPTIKPMAAVVIVTAAAFGAESGFLVGCLTMLASNMFFGQGPWTPWQMFAMGLLGLAAGLIFYRKDVWQRDRLQKRRWLCFYGFLAPVLIYGGIMNPASLLMSSMEITPMSLLGIYLSGLPMDLVHGVTTAVFLAAAGRPMLDKLERVKQKYGL